MFSDDKDTLQYVLNVYEDYCNEWHLTVNIQKTKIVICSRGRANKRHRFTYQDKTIEIVGECKYLGIFLGRSDSYVSAKKHIAKQANKADFALMKKIETLIYRLTSK